MPTDALEPAQPWAGVQVKHGIGHSLVSYPLVPVLNGQLAGDDGGALAGPVIDDLQQVGPGLTVQGGHAPVIEQEDVGIFERVQPARKRAVGVPNTQFLAQARNPQIQRTVATPAGMLGQRARQPGLSRAGRVKDIVPANSLFARCGFTTHTIQGLVALSPS